MSGKVLALRRQEARRNSGFVNPRACPTVSPAGIGRIGAGRPRCPLNTRSDDLVSRTQMDNEPKTFVLNGRQFAKLLDHTREDRGIDFSVRPRVVPFQTRIEPGIEDNRDDINLPSMPDLRPKATLGRMQIRRVDHAKPTIFQAPFGNEANNIECVTRDGLIALIVADERPSMIGRNDFRRSEPFSSEAAFPGTWGADEHHQREVRD